MLAVYHIYTSGDKKWTIIKDDNINVGNMPWIIYVKQCFPYGKINLNVGYYLHLYSVQWTG